MSAIPWHSSVHYIDSLVRDYLVFRKLNVTLKAFDAELKTEKDRGFRVDKIVQLLLHYIHSYDIDGLTSYWNYLKEAFLLRFSKYQISVIEKFEADLCRLYMVRAIQNSKMKELQVCLQKLTELDNVPGLKDWYGLYFNSAADTKSSLTPYFTKQWGETFLVSLHNLLSAVFSCMPPPDLVMAFLKDNERIATLEKENERLHMLTSNSTGNDASISHPKGSYIEHMGRPGVSSKPATPETIKKIPKLKFLQSSKDASQKADSNPSEPQKGVSSPKTVNKFSKSESDKDLGTYATRSGLESPVAKTPAKDYVSSAEVPSSGTVSSVTSIEPTSSIPILQSSSSDKLTGSVEISYEDSISLHKSKDLSLASSHGAKTNAPQTLPSGPFFASDTPFLFHTESASTSSKEPYLILSRDIFHEHHSSVTQCKFDNTGTTIASVDVGGIVKVWQNDPSIKSLTTVILHSKIQCLEWFSKSTDLLILGTVNGTIRFFDITGKITVKEAAVHDPYCSLLGIRICPSGSSFVTSSVKPGDAVHGSRPIGRVMHWDVRSSDISFNRRLSGSNSYSVTCMDYNHNGNLMVLGDVAGTITLFDMKTLSVIHSCEAHKGAVSSVQFSSDEALVLSIGADNEMMAWDVNYIQRQAVKMTFPNSWSKLPMQREPTDMPRMALSPDGNHALVSGGCRGLIYEIDGPGKTATKVLALPEHKDHLTALDWIASKTSGRCLTGSADGKIHVTTLLSQT